MNEIAVSERCGMAVAQTTGPGRMRHWLGSRRGLLALAIAVAGAGVGLALGWDWLTAIGIFPILVGVLPCLALCALGVCMAGGKRRTPEPGAAASGTSSTRQLPGARKNTHT